MIKKAEWNVTPNRYRAGQGKWERRARRRRKGQGRGDEMQSKKVYLS